ncbi:hypothetical protein BN159_8356 [Streptomyces davaonensis JCM 4913]|uniref:Uncharacterized protein n=1 Tax=Streptomyces davaonensis (strain DSM 101723 / JCM 4913 / KCC S-0913 / 768) TaxID=1214101 RepID=K4RGZ7_STRDJ|nr:hypothetical protein [Streptomyces davaonensis]CCK32734.1 hypothetical protein BN159_8356 [Streptomyces davaonensis JCM 4913]
MAETKADQLSRLWDEFMALPFPRGFYRREPEGTCMVSLDTALAGCVASAMEGPLDEWRQGVLRKETAVLGNVLPSIGDDAYASKYFALLHEMGVLAAKVDSARRRGES